MWTLEDIMKRPVDQISFSLEDVIKIIRKIWSVNDKRMTNYTSKVMPYITSPWFVFIYNRRPLFVYVSTKERLLYGLGFYLGLTKLTTQALGDTHRYPLNPSFVITGWPRDFAPVGRTPSGAARPRACGPPARNHSVIQLSHSGWRGYRWLSPRARVVNLQLFRNCQVITYQVIPPNGGDYSGFPRIFEGD